MRTWYFLMSFLLSGLSCLTACAQITDAEIGINGLTCSQCSRSVEMRIRKLDFVKNVQMNLNQTDARIEFKHNKKVEIDKVAQAVVDAGFSVRSLKATLQLDNVTIPANQCLNYNGDNYLFVQKNTSTLKGPVTVQFLGEKYLPKKEFKKWGTLPKNTCGNSAAKTFYVTM